jgi:hypothetical protein
VFLGDTIAAVAGNGVRRLVPMRRDTASCLSGHECI